MPSRALEQRTMEHSGGNLALLLAHPWHRTSLGPLAGWPPEMQALTRSIMASAFPICSAWGPERLQIYNDAYIRIYGSKHPRAFGAPLSQSWEEIWSFLAPAVDEVLLQGRTVAFEAMPMPLVKQGRPEECYYDFSYSPIVAADGRTLGMLSVASDRTGEVVFRRRQAFADAFEQLAGKAAQLTDLAQGLQPLLRQQQLDVAGAALSLHDSDGTPALLWAFGCPLAVLEHLRSAAPAPGAGPVHLLLPDAGAHSGLAGFAHGWSVADRRGRAALSICLCPHPLVPVDSHAAFAQDVAQQLQEAVHAIERRREELQLLRDGYHEAEAFHRFLLDEMDDAVVYTVLDPQPDGPEMVFGANQRACILTGYSPVELAGIPRDALFFPDDRELLSAVQERGRSGSFVGDLVLRRKDGTPLPVEVSSRLVTLDNGETRSVSVVRDISRRLGIEQQRAEAAKVQSLVQLTGGIAHDFNNFLSAILVSLDALSDELPPGAPGRRFVQSAVVGAERAATLTRQLLAYAKQQALQVEELRAEPFLRNIMGLLECAAGHGVALQLALDAGLPSFRADPAQLTSALLNLVANARDAMPQGGRCRIRGLARASGETQAPDGHRLPAGRYVVLEVQDEGTGMPPDLLPRVFEPFFTTKAGAGSGLGLPMVQGFARQSGGDVRIATEPGRGTCVALMLPAS